jgi:lipopolysaccharide transport system permease protein
MSGSIEVGRSMETTTLATIAVPNDGAASTKSAAAPSRAPAPELPTTYIRPASGWQLVNVRELWQYRELLFFLTWRDVKVRYKQTALGAAWAILQPALMMVVFTIFFGRMAKVPTGNLPYPIFVFAGLLPWTFFATAMANAGNSVVGSERLITKIYFPRLAVPLAAVGAAVVDFCIAFLMLVVLMAYYRLTGAPIHPGVSLLLVPVIFFLIVLAATGVGTLLAALNVAYRDFKYVLPFLVQLWLFATPTVYMQPTADASAKMQIALAINPLAGLIASFRSAVLGSPIPWSHLALSAASVVVLFIVGCLYFRKVEDSFADII